MAKYFQSSAICIWCEEPFKLSELGFRQYYGAMACPRCAAKCREGKLPHQKEEMRRWDMEEKENRRWDVQQREEKRRWDLEYKENCRRWNMKLQHELNLAMINREVTVTLERNGVKATFSGPPDVIKEMMRNGSRYVYDDELEMLN